MTLRVILELSWPLTLTISSSCMSSFFSYHCKGCSKGKQQLCCVLVLKVKLREVFLLLPLLGLIVAAARESSSFAVFWF